ncbi:MAG TPA: hypothetical protein VHO67_21505, partial [Polyangia bacterium]|nr:hypothetical protein [Polyangia bacterium]
MTGPRLLVAALLVEVAFAGYGCGSASLHESEDGGTSDAGAAGKATGGHGGGAAGSGTGGAAATPAAGAG